MGNTFYLPFEPVVIQWLQSYCSQLIIAVLSAVTFFGDGVFSALVMGFFYWGYDKQFGKYLAVRLLPNGIYHAYLKNLFVRRRPYMDFKEIKLLKKIDSSADELNLAAQGYSFPSGHSCNSFTVFGSFMAYYRRKWIYIVGGVAIVLVGISRVALGAHYPTDVLAGWLLGFIILIAIGPIERKIGNHIYLLMIISGIPGMFICGSNDYFTAYGLLVGFYGAVVFEEKYVQFTSSHNLKEIVIRVTGGLAVCGVIYLGMKLPLDETFVETSLWYRAVRYAVMSFVGFGIYPMIFKKIKV